MNDQRGETPMRLRTSGITPGYERGPARQLDTLRHIDLSDIPQRVQRQDDLRSQLTDLRAVANRLGMYDAADWLARVLPPLIACSAQDASAR